MVGQRETRVELAVIMLAMLVLVTDPVKGFSPSFCITPAASFRNSAARCSAGPSQLQVGVAAPFRSSLLQSSVTPMEREFELNRGYAVDTLLSDYPSMFVRSCDFSIFTKDVVLEDVQGFRIEGLRAYRAFFSLVPSIVNVCFSKSETSVVLMDKYALDKSRIKLRWRLNLFSRLPGSLSDVFRWIDSDGNGVISSAEYSALQKSELARSKGRMADADEQEPFVVEGISVYKLNNRGQIMQHTIEITSPLSTSLAPLRELLPVNYSPGIVPLSNFVMTPFAQARPLTSSLSIMALQSEAKDRTGDQILGKMGGQQFQSFMKKLPKRCKDDYDCNPGGYNFPLRCMDFVIARFCVDPDDWRNGGLGALAWDPSLVPDPIPVRIQDGYVGPR